MTWSLRLGAPFSAALFACCLASSSAFAGEPTAVVAGAPVEPVTHNTQSSALMIGAHYDQGKASAFGISAVHAWEFGSGRGGLGAMGWAGVGLDGRLVTRGFHDVDGGLGYAVARFSGFSDAGGSGLEFAAGVGGDAHRAFPAAAAGAFMGFYYFEIGYSYQFPIPTFDRPEWLSSHQFSLRVHIPVARYHKRAWDEPVRAQHAAK
jgi:hypothetical protein